MREWCCQCFKEIEDVTERVLAAEKPGMSPQEVMAARDKAIAEIQKEATEKSGLRCQVVSLYSGSMYNLYKYKTYNDVRLVFAVENDIAFLAAILIILLIHVMIWIFPFSESMKMDSR